MDGITIMTKKDYELIAGAFKTLSVNEKVYGKFNLRSVAQKIASVLEDDNPRFDRKRFLEACGTESEQGKYPHHTDYEANGVTWDDSRN